jgi:hypothetical protein
MKPRISERGRKILRDCNLGRAVMMCMIKKKFTHNSKHPMLFEINTIDINNEAERLKNN